MEYYRIHGIHVIRISVCFSSFCADLVDREKGSVAESLVKQQAEQAVMKTELEESRNSKQALEEQVSLSTVLLYFMTCLEVTFTVHSVDYFRCWLCPFQNGP